MGGFGVLGRDAVDLGDLGLAADASTSGGNDSVSIETATSGFTRSARTRNAAWLTCGAEMNVGSTSSSPSRRTSWPRCAVCRPAPCTRSGPGSSR